MKRFFFLVLFLVAISAFCQSYESRQTTESPALVVGIVVDQMRFDYLSKFYPNFSEGGFKRLMTTGAFFKNHHINYVPTVTAAGHASIYTGCGPGVHGIIGNAWYDRTTGEKIYCVHNDQVNPVGTTSPSGRKSPLHLQVSTISDQLKLATQNKSKVISIALKDRAAILSGGFKADASYWFQAKTYGKWITSSYYQEKLPKWVLEFNERKNINSYLKAWEPLYPLATYLNTTTSHNAFERGFIGKNTKDFPYAIDSLAATNQFYSILRGTPHGNTMTFDFVKKAIQEEALGKDSVVDFLMLSCSATDYIGHNFGVDSVELEDTYYRLDKDLADFLQYLDKEVGKGRYLLFLTSDHGAGHVSGYLRSQKIPASYFKQATYRNALSAYLKKKYQIEKPVLSITNQQIYLNTKEFVQKKLELKDIRKEVAFWLRKKPGIEQVFTKEQIENRKFYNGMHSKIKQGYHSKRSGDIVYVLPSYSVAYSRTGSAHGSGYTYDSHIPLLFYGSLVSPKIYDTPSYATDVATTLAALLGIALPDGATGEVLPVTENLK
ncbi:alkaline phosphatase family protein [Aquimarina sp. ERC-38]|uniref:alkaline phosphatase PafA n=1 Tax=Aquimarina sp. ERC-38 TaxID=2949996 RepID=UPI002247B79D|nr:alkaline phosphatase PafA [Aquimarina sp. ERC-38]UZO81086.1 alkaline phosphatase family protein [Aquimarina sp. ERC-38]